MTQVAYIYDDVPRCASHFTGKERDTETGLDYFGARYYGSIMGRFMTPDWAATPEGVPYADLSDPQTLNLYGYVRNNPYQKLTLTVTTLLTSSTTVKPRLLRCTAVRVSNSVPGTQTTMLTAGYLLGDCQTVRIQF